MKQIQSEAIVLAIKDWRGADKIVTLFTRDFGKVTALAYGLRKPKSSLSGCIQLFSQVDVLIESGKSVDVLRQAGLLLSNRLLREDLGRMAYAALAVEVAAELWPEREVQPAVFDALCSAMQLLTERNPRMAAIAVCWQLLSLAGFQPEFDHCICCGGVDQYLFTGFDPESGGVTCTACRQSHQLSISKSGYTLMKRMITLNLAKPEHFSAPLSAIAEAENVLLHFLDHQLGKKLHAISFIQSLGSLG